MAARAFQLLLISGLIALLSLVTSAAAQEPSAAPQIYRPDSKYEYHGCYNETTSINGTDGSRALSGGINEVKKGEMTVPMCLSFCADGKEEYRYAGLEWARECWCAQSISGIAGKLDDAQCSFACEGNKSMACGGSLKLSVYRLSSAGRLAAPGLLSVACVVFAGLWVM